MKKMACLMMGLGLLALGGCLDSGSDKKDSSNSGKISNASTTTVTATLSSLTVTKKPVKVTYGLGETLDLTGLTVTGTYSDGTTKAETITLGNVTGFDGSKEGLNTIIVKVEDKTVAFNVNVKPKLPVKASVQLVGDVTLFNPSDTSCNMTKTTGNVWEKVVTIATDGITAKQVGDFNHADKGSYGANAPSSDAFVGLYRFKFTQENKWDGTGQYGAGWWKTPEAQINDDFSQTYGDGLGEMGDVFTYIGYNVNGKWNPISLTQDVPVVGPIIVEVPRRGGADNGCIALKKNSTYKFTLDLDNYKWSVELIK